MNNFDSSNIIHASSDATLVSTEERSLSLSLTLNEEFTEELNDETSLVYLNKSRSITTKVSPILNT